jgi:hypothetical protein
MDPKTVNQMQMLAYASAPVIAFVCECGDPACRQTVPLTASAYHDLRIDCKPVLHAGHTPVEDTPLAAEALWVSSEEGHIRRVKAALKIS